MPIDGAPFVFPRVNLRAWGDPAFWMNPAYENVQNANITFVMMAVLIGISLLFVAGGIVWALTRKSGKRPENEKRAASRPAQEGAGR